jgi:hypothetical protein
MKKFAQWLSAVTFLLLTSCSGESGSSATGHHTATGNSRVSEDNVFSSPVKSLERAEQLNRMVLDHKKSIDARLQ